MHTIADRNRDVAPDIYTDINGIAATHPLVVDMAERSQRILGLYIHQRLASTDLVRLKSQP